MKISFLPLEFSYVKSTEYSHLASHRIHISLSSTLQTLANFPLHIQWKGCLLLIFTSKLMLAGDGDGDDSDKDDDSDGVVVVMG